MKPNWGGREIGPKRGRERQRLWAGAWEMCRRERHLAPACTNLIQGMKTYLEARIMTPIIDTPTQQDPRTWSARIGDLAAQNVATPADFTTRLSAILHSLRRRQETADSLKANHFILGD